MQSGKHQRFRHSAQIQLSTTVSPIVRHWLRSNEQVLFHDGPPRRYVGRIQLCRPDPAKRSSGRIKATPPLSCLSVVGASSLFSPVRPAILGPSCALFAGDFGVESAECCNALACQLIIDSDGFLGNNQRILSHDVEVCENHAVSRFEPLINQDE